MRNKLFEELKESIKQGGKILNGKKKPGREFNFKSPYPKRIRERLRLSQDKFARLLGISLSTLQNWEQGRRKPDGSARVLLNVAAKFPDEVLNTVYNQ